MKPKTKKVKVLQIPSKQGAKPYLESPCVVCEKAEEVDSGMCENCRKEAIEWANDINGQQETSKLPKRKLSVIIAPADSRKGKETENSKCIMWNNGKCNSDYGKELNCDGIKAIENCPYKTENSKIETMGDYNLDKEHKSELDNHLRCPKCGACLTCGDCLCKRTRHGGYAK